MKARLYLAAFFMVGLSTGGVSAQQFGADASAVAIDNTCTPVPCGEENSDPADFGMTSSSISALAGNAAASASSSLATGTMRSFSATSVSNYPANVIAESQTELQDTINIIGNVTKPVTATLTLSVDGTLTDSAIALAAGINNTASAIATFYVEPEESGQDGNIQVWGSMFESDDCSMKSSFLCSVGSKVSTSGSITFTIAPGHTTFFIDAALGTDSMYGGVADFSDTAALSLSLPAALSYTSASGLFLSEAEKVVPAVPEPSDFAMFAIGVGFLGFVARMRKACSHLTLS